MTIRKLVFPFVVFAALVSLYLLVIQPVNAKPSNRSIEASPKEWSIECIDCPKSFLNSSDRSLQIDADGHSHLVYGGDQLYYAWNDGESWNYETVDTARGTGNYASLALDSSGYPHVSYYDKVNGDLKYAYQDIDGWHIETVDSQDDVGKFPSIALDTTDQPHISYSDNTTAELKYASFDGSSWSIETVDSLGSPDYNNSLAMDSNDLPHISYYNATVDGLKYAHWNGATWEIQLVYAPYSGEYSSIAVDSNNLPHISFVLHFYSTYNLMYAYWDAEGWDIQMVDDEYTSGIYNSIDLDASDNPAIAYSTLSCNLKYASWNGISWDLQTVDGSYQTCGYVSLALDSNGRPSINYQIERLNDDPIHTLNLAVWEGSTWNFETIDHASEAGGPTSLALDESGLPRVAYRTGVRIMGMPFANLSYAQWDGNAWQSDVVDGDNNVNWNLSMDLDENGNPHIAFPNYTDSNIRYADWTGTTWDIQTIGQGNGYVSLALDQSNYPHLAFSQYHAYWDGDEWIYEVVDTGAQGVSIAIDSHGYAHISYYQNYQIKYAWWNGSEWNTQIVDPNIGTYTAQPSLALDGNDHPHISYYADYPNGVLMYATSDGGEWVLQTVDSGGDVGNYSSIAVDSQNLPHISYLDIANADLKYAYWDGFDWIIQTIADVGYASASTSLKLDASNLPVISYFDWTTRDVMLARLTGEPVAPETVEINGAAEGEVGSSLVYTATTSPISTTLPVKYIWEATDQMPITITNGLLSSVDYSWDFPGTKVITVTTSNAFGAVNDIFEVNISDIPVSGLAAISDSPTELGETTTFTATISSGTNVSYWWDFGDGSTADGAMVTHVYPDAGEYTASVTASNGTNSQTANIPATILPIDTTKRIFLPTIRK